MSYSAEHQRAARDSYPMMPHDFERDASFIPDPETDTGIDICAICALTERESAVARRLHGIEPTPTLRPVIFQLPEVYNLDGYTDDTTWNGWLNVWITADDRTDLVATLRNLGDAQAADDIERLAPDANGLISLNGYCTTEQTIDEAGDDYINGAPIIESLPGRLVLDPMNAALPISYAETVEFPTYTGSDGREHAEY